MKKDKTAVLDRIRKRTTPEQREFVKMNLCIVKQITSILKKKGWTQKEFAQKIGKKESEISRMLTGMHNISLRSLAKIKVVLDEEIITTPIEACDKYKNYVFVTLDDYAKPNKPEKRIYPESSSNIRIAYTNPKRAIAS